MSYKWLKNDNSGKYFTSLRILFLDVVTDDNQKNILGDGLEEGEGG